MVVRCRFAIRDLVDHTKAILPQTTHRRDLNPGVREIGTRAQATDDTAVVLTVGLHLCREHRDHRPVPILDRLSHPLFNE